MVNVIQINTSQLINLIQGFGRLWNKKILHINTEF